MKFELGPGLKCDLQALIDSRALIQANSGGGKSHTLRRILEQTHGHVQQLVIDPEGEFASLREKHDYVLAAHHGGDTAADPRSAKLLAERLLELGVSAILDIYELKAHERIRFVRLFLEALVDAKKELWHPALVVVDEAHVFCPQQGEAESAGAVIDLATRGRKRGFCAILATQRLSKLHKDAAAELNNKLVGRTGLDVDRKRAAEELGFTSKEQSLELRNLEPGEFFAFGTALSAEVKRVTIGPVHTTHPKTGARLAIVAPPPTAKVKALLPKLADLPAEAEGRTKTLQDLQRDNAVLRGQVTRLERGAPARVETKVETKVERVEVPVLKDEPLRLLLDAIAQLRELFTGSAQLAERLTDVRGEVGRIARTLEVTVAQAHENGRVAAARVQTSAVPRPHVPPADPGRVNRQFTIDKIDKSGGGEVISGLQRRILDALAWLESAGLCPANRWQVALIAESSASSSYFENTVSGLRSAGLVTYPAAGSLELTDQGRAEAHPPEGTIDVATFQESLLGRLGGLRARLLRAALDAYPQPLSRAELAEASQSSHTSSYFENEVSGLRSLGLIDYPAPGQVVALPVLFLDGVR